MEKMKTQVIVYNKKRNKHTIYNTNGRLYLVVEYFTKIPWETIVAIKQDGKIIYSKNEMEPHISS